MLLNRQYLPQSLYFNIDLVQNALSLQCLLVLHNLFVSTVQIAIYSSFIYGGNKVVNQYLDVVVAYFDAVDHLALGISDQTLV